MRTCDTCRHWRHGRFAHVDGGIAPTESKFGLCFHPKLRDEIASSWLGDELKEVPIDGIEVTGELRGSFNPGPKFGCIHHEFEQSKLQDRFWYNTECQTCGAVNEKAEDSRSGWRFYHTPDPQNPNQNSVTYTCPKCPQLPGARVGYENY